MTLLHARAVLSKRSYKRGMQCSDLAQAANLRILEVAVLLSKSR